jgi:hypothetical protein
VAEKCCPTDRKYITAIREAINNDEARKAEKLKKAELVGSPLRT